MAYNGSGTFLINTAGQPVVSGTVISSTAFNALTADLATGLSTAITKDGQTTVTANIPMSTYKFTGLGVGSAATDSANLSQVQSTVTKLLNSVSGADTITATASPTLAAYAAGQMFYFVAAGDNTTSVTLNIDSLGAKAVTRDGSVALAAADIKSGEVVVVVYDGTRFQVVSQLNSAGDATFANVSITSALNVGGVATFSGDVGIGTASPGYKLDVRGVTASGNGTITTGFTYDTRGLVGTFSNHALGFITNGTSPSMLLDTSGNLGIGTTTIGSRVTISDPGTGLAFSNAASGNFNIGLLAGTGSALAYVYQRANSDLLFGTNNTERARITSGGVFCVNSSTNVGSEVTLFKQTAGAGSPVTRTWNNETSGNNEFIEFATEASYTARGSITYNRGGGLVAYNTTSDYRAKDILGPVQNSGATIDALKVYEGVMKGATQSRPMLIAHEAQEYAPYAVSGVKDEVKEDGTPKYQQIDVSALVPLLLAEVQSLRKRVAELESK